MRHGFSWLHSFCVIPTELWHKMNRRHSSLKERRDCAFSAVPFSFLYFIDASPFFGGSEPRPKKQNKKEKESSSYQVRFFERKFDGKVFFKYPFD